MSLAEFALWAEKGLAGRGNASKEREDDGQLHGECLEHILLVWTSFNGYKKAKKGNHFVVHCYYLCVKIWQQECQIKNTPWRREKRSSTTRENKHQRQQTNDIHTHAAVAEKALDRSGTV
jgi:hypothetical protein